MHELSIAQSLIDTLTEMLIRQNIERISTATVEIGALSGVDPAALRSAFLVARRGTEMSQTTLTIVPVPVQIDCPTCSQITAAIARQNLRCALCGQSSARIVRGRELEIVSIEVFDFAHELETQQDESR